MNTYSQGILSIKPLLTLCLALSLVQAQTVMAEPPVRFGVPVIEPFLNQSTEEIVTGDWVELATQLFSQAGYKIEFIPLPAARLNAALRSGKIEVTATPHAYDELPSYVLPEPDAVTIVTLGLGYNLNSPPPSKSNETIKIITINGYLYGGQGRLKRALEQITKKPEIIAASNHQNAVRMLEMQRAKYLLTYQHIAAGLNKHGKELLFHPLDKMPLVLLVSKNSTRGQQIKSKLHLALLEMYSSGELADRLSKIGLTPANQVAEQ